MIGENFDLSTSQRVGVDIGVNGKRERQAGISEADLVSLFSCLLINLERCTKAIGRMIKDMVMGYRHVQVASDMLVNLRMIGGMERVFSYGLMVDDMKEIFWKGRCTDKVYLNGLVVNDMRDSLKMTR